MFHSTAGKLPLVENNVCPKYQNEETSVSGVPYSKKTRPICSSVSSTTNLGRYSLSYPGTSLRLGAPNLGPHVEQTCHTGGTGGGVDFPPPGLLFCSEGIGDQIVPGGLSVSTLSLGIPPQVTSIGQG